MAISTKMAGVTLVPVEEEAMRFSVVVEQRSLLEVHYGFAHKVPSTNKVPTDSHRPPNLPWPVALLPSGITRQELARLLPQKSRHSDFISDPFQISLLTSILQSCIASVGPRSLLPI